MKTEIKQILGRLEQIELQQKAIWWDMLMLFFWGFTGLLWLLGKINTIIFLWGIIFFYFIFQFFEWIDMRKTRRKR